MTHKPTTVLDGSPENGGKYIPAKPQAIVDKTVKAVTLAMVERDYVDKPLAPTPRHRRPERAAVALARVCRPTVRFPPQGPPGRVPLLQRSY
jgi:hypothetical protein